MANTQHRMPIPKQLTVNGELAPNVTSDPPSLRFGPTRLT
jgi:hypothetical protein